MKYKLTMKISFYVILGMIITGFVIHFHNNPAVLIRTEISPIDDETYNQLGLYDKVEFPDKSKFQEIAFSLKVNYPNEVENLEVRIPQYFTELFGNDLYLGSTYKEYNDAKKSQYIHEAEIILYTGEVSNEEIKTLLNKGNVLLGWDLRGERVRQSYNIGDTVVFIK